MLPISKTENMRLSEPKTIVIFMPSDPEPDKIISLLHCNRPIMNADARGPEAAGLFEMKRAMRQIAF